MPAPLWERVDEFRFSNRFDTETGAVLALIERGLAVAPETPTAALVRED